MNTAEFIKVLEEKNIPHTVSGKWVCVKGGSVNLNSLTSLSGNVKFENGSYVNLYSLTSISGNVKFENDGNAYLYSLTSLSGDVKFDNSGSVYLASFSSPFQIYRGQQIEIRNIDGLTMLITSKRAFGEYEIYRAKYFGGGDIESLDNCYIAKRGGVYAHGSTVKEAFEDLNFKLAERTGKKDIIEQVKKSQQVTVKDFRILTGACREGIRQHLLSHEIDIDQIESMSLDDALEAMSGTTYGGIFKSELEGDVEWQ